LNILHTECSLNWGGLEQRIVVETCWLNKHGHKASIACDPRSELYRRGREAGASVLGVSMRSNFDLPGFIALCGIVRKCGIDLINTHGSKDSWLCYPLHVAGIPVVRSRHLTLRVTPGARSFIYKHGCRRVIATAAMIRRDLIETNGIAPERIDVVGEFVDLDEFNPAIDGRPFRDRFDIPANAPLVGIVAMIRGEKGHRIFLDAAFAVLKTHPGARFVLVGEGTGERKLEIACRARIEKAFGAPAPGTSIKMTGFQRNIPEVIAALDIVVVPSKAEAQSRIIPEAFAMRRAVIGSRVGGIPELVEDGKTGLLVPPGDADALAAAIKRLIDDANLRKSLADAGHALALRDLSLDQKMEQTLAIYRKAVDAAVLAG